MNSILRARFAGREGWALQQSFHTPPRPPFDPARGRRRLARRIGPETEDLPLDPKYYGLIELLFSGTVVLAFAFYQLWTVMPSRRGPEQPEEAKEDTRAER